MKGDRERCLASGMDGYIAKPILGQDLYLEIERVTLSLAKVSTSSVTSNDPPFDQILLRKRLDNDDQLLREVVDIFQKNHAVLVQAISQAIQKSDPQALVTATHALKGALATFAAKPALDLVCRLETMGREKQIDDSERTYRELEIEVARLRSALAIVSDHVLM
jgi:HPt (histidine-containing phosphotransfer) domain-containing protein